MKSNNNVERVAFIVILIVLYFIFNGCSTKKKIDYKKYPHYPYVIEKIKR